MSGFKFGSAGFVGSLKIGSSASAYISPYSKTGLTQYHDVNFGASGVILNASNQITTWKNQIVGGVDLTLTTGTAPNYLKSVDGFPAIDAVAGGVLGATIPATGTQPLSITLLIKVIRNPSSANYITIFSAGYMTLIQKFTTDSLIQEFGANNTGVRAFVVNEWTPITIVWSSGKSLAVFGVDSSIYNINPTSFTDFVITGEVLHRLFLAYNRGLTLSEITTLHSQIKTAYNLP